MSSWNPWHGCRKLSAGCLHCYVYRIDARHGRDASVVSKTGYFGLPVSRRRDGTYRIPSGQTVYTCFTSDFFLEEADPWRVEAWRMIRERPDLRFFIVTKRIDRLSVGLPADWGEGYPNVSVCCTAEDQDRADHRLPIFREAPIRDKSVICEPLLGPIDLTAHLGSWLASVAVGGESGEDARPCDYDWVLDIRRQCVEAGVAFHFRQTGARFVKDGKGYRIRKDMQQAQARKAGIDT